MYLDMSGLLTSTRIRRVRCGEEKPHCLRCSSTSRQSLQPGPASTHNRVERPLQQNAALSSAASRKRRAFEFYFHQAGPALSGNLDLEFWIDSLLQICRLEPLVWDAIIYLTLSLIGCILFIAIKLLQGSRKAAMALYNRGAELLGNVMAFGGHSMGHPCWLYQPEILGSYGQVDLSLSENLGAHQK